MHLSFSKVAIYLRTTFLVKLVCTYQALDGAELVRDGVVDGGGGPRPVHRRRGDHRGGGVGVGGREDGRRGGGRQGQVGVGRRHHGHLSSEAEAGPLRLLEVTAADERPGLQRGHGSEEGTVTRILSLFTVTVQLFSTDFAACTQDLNHEYTLCI